MQPARHLATLLACLACLACSAAGAQSIYRCGDSYSQQPCAGGRQLAPAAPAPSAADRKQAATAAMRDARLADSLEKDRTRREAQAASTPFVLQAPAPEQPEPHKWPEKAGTRKLDVFTASAPKTNSKAKQASAKSKPPASKKASDKDKAATGQPKRVQPVKTAAAGKS